jgi:hypothetical protein
MITDEKLTDIIAEATENRELAKQIVNDKEYELIDLSNTPSGANRYEQFLEEMGDELPEDTDIYDYYDEKYRDEGWLDTYQGYFIRL